MAVREIKPVVLDLDRLENLAESGYYNPYTMFDWPDSIEPDLPWMSESLTTLAGTPMWDELTREQQIALTRYEAINFFSLNIHGIRELMSEVVMRIHERTYADVSEFLHHFIGEENEHMWFFAQFCLRYGGKLYPAQPTLKADSVDHLSPVARELIVFARILIFEEIVDYFNAHMATDQSLPPIAREINRVHHQDESRHVAFGRMIFTHLLGQVAERDPQEVPLVAEYLENYLQYSISTLYNPAAYRDAGIPDALALRRRALEHPARVEAHDQVLKRTRKFLTKAGVGREAIT
ncbi:AurF domain containing protein [Streptomyces alfalfae]|uniref:AurF domain containing protein n=1 Tax=Streptomyces alfalfae TaxID=1642299 RepID=A0A1P8TRX1_9ACTN|nr:diiron oxygenase [Streptomyces alfalfae]AYA14965.1 AurF domain containing protein [Streptomyces fradiae]APY84469.1 AurF domain containing protein [Streptomyces alfalfae]APY90379.1 AurF domain containing protein [Streptomyces alfalfae]QQC87105.1 diiron oxygenase [Streptomyces alfalfae]QQC93398.1 diiron oxygenase [Streptomyces alfalfae]